MLVKQLIVFIVNSYFIVKHINTLAPGAPFINMN